MAWIGLVLGCLSFTFLLALLLSCLCLCLLLLLKVKVKDRVFEESRCWGYDVT